jgi:flavin reductase (DIM6/NTAB) family NADH-FMN oxidoreductase RutF
MSDDRQKGLTAALGRIPSGLFVVTARRGESETGMLASWVQQCSFGPPQLTMCLRRGRDINTWLEDGAAFTVNVIEDDGSTDLIVHFGRGFGLDEPAFEGVEVYRPGGAPPVLREALAYLECRVAARWPVGDHDLFVGRVVAGGTHGEGKPMVHVRKSGMHY